MIDPCGSAVRRRHVSAGKRGSASLLDDSPLLDVLADALADSGVQCEVVYDHLGAVLGVFTHDRPRMKVRAGLTHYREYDESGPGAVIAPLAKPGSAVSEIRDRLALGR